MANNKVYYGEYSLDYWIKLILSKNIVIPKYQRNFSWNEERREKLISSLKNGEFVPPVVIGSFSKGGIKENLLIDGQQRLTSILLSVLGYFPDREKFRKNSKDRVRKYVDENDEQDEEDTSHTDVINWNFSDLLNKEDLTLSDIRNHLEKEEYFKKLDNQGEIDNNFLKTTFLGFSYLVPGDSGDGAQQKYYSSVFRNINRQAMSLSGQESRESLYYLDDKMKSFFKPNFIEEMETNSRIDFVRYLSILSQYKKEHGYRNLCRGYGGKREKLEEYYENYITFIINSDTSESSDFIGYKDMFGSDRESRGHEQPHDRIFNNLEQFIRDTPLWTREFDSIIDCDLYYFGLIYFMVFENKVIDLQRWETLAEKIESQIKKYKAPDEYPSGIFFSYHQKNPSALKYIRERVAKSLEIYKEFVN